MMKPTTNTGTTCPCTYPGCDRHGNCKACKDYHHALGQKTACEERKA